MRQEHLNLWRDYYPPEYPQLKLVLGAIELVLLGEEILTYNRVPILEKEISRSLSGTTIISDTCKMPHYSWSLELHLGIPQMDKLDAINFISDNNRKILRSNYEVTLQDICKPILELNVTRPNVLAWNVQTEGLTKYFAQFKASISSLESTPNGYGYNATVELIEI